MDIPSPETRAQRAIQSYKLGHFKSLKAAAHRDNWIPLDLSSSMEGTAFATSPNGYTDHELGFEWVCKVFHPATVGSSRGRTRLLLMDGHSSHLTSQFLGFCHDHDILPLCLPPHTTHMLQPLDVGCFAPLAHYYRAEVDEASHYGLHGVSKFDFLQFYSVARQKAFTAKNISSAFRKSGFVPLDPSVILDKLIPQAEQPESSTQQAQSPARPTTASSSLQTPRDYARLLEYCHRLERYLESQGHESSPSRALCNKVCHAVVRKSAEFAILTKENAGLTKVIAAKATRKSSKRKVLSTGRVLTLFQVHELRREEEKRGKKRQREDDETEVDKTAKKAPKARTVDTIENRQGNGTSSTFSSLEATVSKVNGADAPQTGALDNSVHTGATPVKARKAPPKCSGCNSLGHNYRSCPNK